MFVIDSVKYPIYKAVDLDKTLTLIVLLNYFLFWFYQIHSIRNQINGTDSKQKQVIKISFSVIQKEK